MYKCLIFDFDGTIVDSNLIKKSLFYEVLNEFDIDKNELKVQISIDGKSRNQIIAGALSKYSEEVVLKSIKRYSLLTFDKISRIKPNKYFFEIVEYCKKNGIYLVLSSNTPENELIKIIKEMSLFNIFDEVHGYPKLKSESLNKIIIENNFLSNQTLVIGDGESDKLSAEVNNCDFIRINKNSLKKLKQTLIC